MDGWSTNLQAYGLTEYSCITITHCNPSHGRRPAKPGSVGFIVSGIELKFLDQHTGLSLPVNVPGELCVRGESCMKGKEIQCNLPHNLFNLNANFPFSTNRNNRLPSDPQASAFHPKNQFSFKTLEPVYYF